VLSAIYLENYVILNCIFTTLRNRDAVIFVYHRLEIRITFRIAPGLGRLFFVFFFWLIAALVLAALKPG